MVAAVMLVFLFSEDAFGQSQVIRIEEFGAQTGGNALGIKFNIVLGNVRVPSSNQLIFTPVLRSKSGTKRETVLHSVILNGKSRNNLYKRSLSLNGLGNGYMDPAVYSVMAVNINPISKTITSEETIPFEPWMNGANVYLIKDMIECCDDEHHREELLIAEGITPTSATPSVTPPASKLPKEGDVAQSQYLQEKDKNTQKPPVKQPVYTPIDEFVTPPQTDKERHAERGEAFLYFRQGEAKILPDIADNAEELAEIDNALNYIKNNPEATISALIIRAYASPEGDADYNLALSQRRAAALLTYVSEKHHLSPNVRVIAEGMGEDWAKLADLITADINVSNKNQVLNILRMPVVVERKRKLEDFDDGQTYQYISAALYPRLRRTNYTVEFTTPLK
jgi:outer membrane protein OmpA-like peptidoglycan-associated protein